MQRDVPLPSNLAPRFDEYRCYLESLPRAARRSLQHQWKRSLAGIALLLALGQAPALAATINVTAKCTLTEAITTANRDLPVPGCTRGSGPDRIVLPTNRDQILNTSFNNPYGTNGLPVISSVITIAGNNRAIRRATTAPGFRILAVNATGNLTLQNTIVTGGRAQTNANVGGGIYNVRGVVTLSSSTVSGNLAFSGGGISTSNGDVIISNSTLTQNTASQRGGGIVSYYNSQVTLTSSTISGNVSRRGGGAYSSRGSVQVTNSTFSGNSANPGTYQGSGGAIEVNRYSSLNAANTTLTLNTAARGGGVFVDNYSNANFDRSLVSGNTNPGGVPGREVLADYGTTIAANNYNLFGHSYNDGVRGFTPGDLDFVPRVGPNAIRSPNLANNGGRTATHALLSSGSAVDNARTCPPPMVDQRGLPRPIDRDGDRFAECDIGSYELQ